MTQNTSRLKVWTVCALIAIGSTLAALVTSGPAGGSATECLDNQDCGCTLEQEMQGCTPGSGAQGVCINAACDCNDPYVGLFCQAVGGACCYLADIGSDGGTGAALNSPPASCQVTTVVACGEGLSGEYQGDGTTCDPDPCNSPTPTNTPTATPTSTPTATPAGQGGNCELTSDCLGGLTCADNFCCNETCDDPGERCDAQGLEGTCTSIAPAPAASHQAIVFIVALLGVIGGLGMLRQRRRQHP